MQGRLGKYGTANTEVEKQQVLRVRGQRLFPSGNGARCVRALWRVTDAWERVHGKKRMWRVLIARMVMATLKGIHGNNNNKKTYQRVNKKYSVFGKI